MKLTTSEEISKKADQRGTGERKAKLYPAEAKEEAKKTSQRGTGEKKEQLYPAEAEKEAEKTSQRGTGERKERLYPAEVQEEKIQKINRNPENQKMDSRLQNLQLYFTTVIAHKGWKQQNKVSRIKEIRIL